MTRPLAFFALFLCIFMQAKADHITGGEIFYTYTSTSNGSYNYHVTFKLFMRCNSNRQFNDPTVVSIFDKATGERVTDISVSLSSSETIRITTPDPCVTNPPDVCYVVGYYTFNVTLPARVAGYVLSSQVNFRINGISNLQRGYDNVGALYAAEIPGTQDLANGPQNSSARFVGDDLVVICANNRFSYSFAATDADGDELSYSFCNAYISSGSSGPRVTPTSSPPYFSVPYGNGFVGASPLGDNVQINAKTGVISGIAPNPGIYVITVCVTEKRNGVIIATQRKDLQVNIAPCNVAGALIPPGYMLCHDSKTIDLVNQSTSSLIRTQYWEISTQQGKVLFSSGELSPSYTFADTGTYRVKLVINRGQSCSDSTVSVAYVYPGFKPAFSFSGICFTKPTFFTDASTTTYGRVNSWSWTLPDTAVLGAKNFPYTFKNMGSQTVLLTVTNSVGCVDTAMQTVEILERPPLGLAFRDTLICVGDQVQLVAATTGNLHWSSPTATVAQNNPSPVVSPQSTTIYKVDLNDNGCENMDSVLVRVTDHVDLKAMSDTVVCKGDTIQLHVVSDGFTFDWAPEAQFTNAHVANPLVVAKDTTVYTVVAHIGGCAAQDDVKVMPVPYPLSDAGAGVSICYNGTTQLQGFTNGKSIRWSPASSLSDASITSPIAHPRATTSYILAAFDNMGCPKPGLDTVVVQVLAKVVPDAGHDTTVVINQPLQLHASGGPFFHWSPSYGLSDADTSDPVAIFNEPLTDAPYKLVVSNEAGCADSVSIKISVFATAPTVFVPSAFTPNADGKNDVLRPLAAGIKTIAFFKVYNRWGQLMFSTRHTGDGWDGTINGNKQNTGTYVWVVKATDYTNKPYVERGTVLLIR